MQKAIMRPNLPARPVTLCAIGDYAEKIRLKLERFGVNVLSLTRDKRLSYAVASHADMLICHVGGKHVVSGSEANLTKLRGMGFDAVLAEKVPQPSYPSDVHLNQLIMGNFATGRMDACDPAVQRALEEMKINYIDIRQGYARCSAAVISEKALITADYAVAKAAIRHGIDVLVIRPGYIELPDFEYGFIGGACGLIAPDRLAVAGNIERHPDGDRMIAFMAHYGVVAECLHDGPLVDIGGILPLMEQAAD